MMKKRIWKGKEIFYKKEKSFSSPNKNNTTSKF